MGLDFRCDRHYPVVSGRRKTQQELRAASKRTYRSVTGVWQSGYFSALFRDFPKGDIAVWHRAMRFEGGGLRFRRDTYGYR